jgi:SsrA-binding protein
MTAKEQFSIENRKAFHEYHVGDTYDAGLVLQGWEVKAILAGRASFSGSGAFVALRGNEAFLEGLHVTALATTSNGFLDTASPVRSRKLLLNRAELDKLRRNVAERGFTVVPLRLTRAKAGAKLKLTVGLAKGKKLHDKRATEKSREMERDARREAVR